MIRLIEEARFNTIAFVVIIQRILYNTIVIPLFVIFSSFRDIIKMILSYLNYYSEHIHNLNTIVILTINACNTLREAYRGVN